MDKTTAHKILLDYLEDKADPAQYQAALDFLASHQADPARPESPAALFQHLIKPGGIDCETSQNLMLSYLDPFARLTMSQQDQTTLRHHLAGCRDCREEFEFLSIPESAFNFEIEPALTGATDHPSQTIPPVSWPGRLQMLVERLTDKANSLKVAIHFRPALGPVTGSYTRAANDNSKSDTSLTLLDQTIGRNLPVKATIYCSRPQATDAECTVRVSLSGPALFNRAERHRVTLAYLYQNSNASREDLTDRQGEAVFTGVPVAALPTLEVKFSVDI